MNELGNRARSQAERREAEALARAVLDRVPLGNPRERCSRRWGMRSGISGRPDEAVPCYSEAYTSAKERGDLANAGTCAHQLGLTHRDRGAWDEAARAFDEAIALLTRTGAGHLTLLGSRTERLGVDVRAGRGAAVRGAMDALVAELEALFEESRKPDWKPEPDAPGTPAHVLVGVLDIRNVLAHHEKDTSAALRLVKQLSGAPIEDIPLSLGNRGTFRKNANDLDGAEQDLWRAADVFTQAGHALYRSKCLSSLAQIAEKRGNLARSVELEQEALELACQAGDLGDAAISHNNVSPWLTKLGRHDDAGLHATAALLLCTLFRPHAWIAARNLQNALAATGPGVSPPSLVALEKAFPRLVPLLAARGLDRAALETHLATVLAQREALAAQAGLEADDAETVEAAASDEFRALLTHLGLSPDLPPAEAVAAALTAIRAEIAAIDAATSK